MTNLMFWVYAYILTLSAIIFAIRGWRSVKNKDYATHQSMMGVAINLILFFVVSYVVKVLVLGREDRTNWSNFYLYTLYIHETFIALMLVTGAWARRLAYLFKASIGADQLSEVQQAQRKRHAQLGKACILSALCGLFTATIILVGMASRL